MSHSTQIGHFGDKSFQGNQLYWYWQPKSTKRKYTTHKN